MRIGRGMLAARFKFEPRDLWVGVYWDGFWHKSRLDVYVCLVPCLPLHVTWWRYWP